MTGEREVGIDVEAEEGDRDFLRLAEVGLDEEATAVVRDAPADRRAAAFYAAWVRREAIVKCAGTGLTAPLPPLPVCVRGLEVGKGHAAAIAVAGTEALTLRIYSLAAA